VIYRLLGELEIGDDGRLVRLPAGFTLVLLAALMVNANRPMSAAELIRVVWGSDVKQAQLHKRINALRALLDQVGRRDDLKTHHGFGYELRAAAEDVDALMFQRLVQKAARAESEHRTEDEINDLRQALSLWNGAHALSNVPGESLYQDIATLERRRRRAAARLYGIELALGNHESILDELILITRSYPADQRLCEQLMLAAHRCGHPADVANAYERYREALAEQTGGVPDSLLRTFHFAVARGDEAAIARAESAIGVRAGLSARPVITVPRQLPRPPGLVGRDDLVAEVSWLLLRELSGALPVVVISGPGGIGKTALAVQAAHKVADRYPDGQLYAELRGTADGGVDTSEVLAQFLRAFGVPRVPEEKQERLAAYRTLLSGRRVLVVLDDAFDGDQVNDLIPANPRCGVVVTARQRLPEVSGSHHVPPLEPLLPADATELLLRIVEEAGIGLEGELDAVGRVVALCGGLPLALRIAGALRVQAHPRPMAELADRLTRQGPAAFAYKNLNLARTFGAGFDRLDATARRLFLGLGLLRLASFGQWTAAALLTGTDADPTAALSQLAASFMIEPVEPQMRYRLHDLTREYACRRALAEYPDGRDQVPSQAYLALLSLARNAHMRLYGGDFEVIHSTAPDWAAPPEALAEVDTSPLDWFEKERANIRAVVGHCAALGLSSICWDLAVSAHEFYSIRGYFDDWYATHTVALAACRQAGDRRGEGIVLACLNQPALMASRRADGAAALADLERAAALLAECGDRHGQAIALRTLANALYRRGHLTRTLALFNEALGHYEASGDTVGRWQTLRFIGQTCLLLGRHGDARHALEQALALAGELGRERLIAQTRYWTGQVCLATGDLEEAQAAFGAVLDTYRDDTGLGHAYAVHGLGEVALSKGAYELAEQHLAEAASLASEDADAFLEGRAWLSTAALHEARRQPDEQIMAIEHAVAVFTECDAAYLEARALAALARARTDRGDVTGAGAAWTRIEGLYDAAGLPEQDRIHHRPQR
jgi:DNA-binding SARP family transcriptional activator/tetratricopeptide (TPR) repeat protein